MAVARVRDRRPFASRVPASDSRVCRCIRDVPASVIKGLVMARFRRASLFRSWPLVRSNQTGAGALSAFPTRGPLRRRKPTWTGGLAKTVRDPKATPPSPRNDLRLCRMSKSVGVAEADEDQLTITIFLRGRVSSVALAVSSPSQAVESSGPCSEPDGAMGPDRCRVVRFSSRRPPGQVQSGICRVCLA